MRKLMSGLFISLDGVTEAPNLWQFDNFDEDMGAALGEIMEARDTVVMGRKTYDEWASYWPTTTNDEGFATYINNAPKYVVSTSLEKADWNNTTILRSLEDVAALRDQSGTPISVMGSPTLVRSLLNHGLLDELILMIHPVVAGSGKRLFADGDDLKRMKLVESKTSRTGVILATYHPLEH